ncbi:hypothetical protein OU790_19025 [Ruegeria sp. NA]|nr:hypothetical protein [Ruegeria sp. NA]MCX8955513.1 hypothetical protein [Ruegeria sp. NA]
MAATTRIPAEVMGLTDAGRLAKGEQCPLIRIARDLSNVDVLV